MDSSDFSGDPSGHPGARYMTEAFTTDQLTIETNATKPATIVWPIKKSFLENWADDNSETRSIEVTKFPLSPDNETP